jgi:hypothetical protein
MIHAGRLYPNRQGSWGSPCGGAAADLAAGDDDGDGDAEGDGQLERGAFRAEIGGTEVDGDAIRRKGKARIADAVRRFIRDEPRELVCCADCGSRSIPKPAAFQAAGFGEAGRAGEYISARKWSA